MKKIHRLILTVLVAVMMVLTSVGSVTFVKAAGNPAITVAPVKTLYQKDEQVTVNVSVSNNPGILGATLVLTYDDENLELLNAKKGSAFSVHALTKPGQFVSGCKFVFDAQDLEDEDIKDGTFLELTFKAKENSETSLFNISVSYTSGGIIDNNLNPVNASITNGSFNLYNVGNIRTNLVYGGSEQNIIENNFISNGKLLYALAADGEYSEGNLKYNGTGTHDVYYKVVDSKDETVVSATKLGSFTISKGDYTEGTDYDIPDNLSSSYGRKLGDVELPDGWAWDNPDDYVGTPGVRTHGATFWPDENSNYNPFSTDLSISVSKCTPKILSTPAVVSSLYYDGEIKTLASAAAAENGTIKYAVVVSGTQIDENTLFNLGTPTAVTPGSYDVYYKVIGNQYYSDLGPYFIGTSTVYGSGVHISEIELSAKRTELILGHDTKNSTAVSVTFHPDEFDEERDITWYSYDENVVTVDENGVVTAVAPGKTYVKATTVNGIYSTIEITVSDKRAYKVDITCGGKTETQYVVEGETIEYPEMAEKTGFRFALFNGDEEFSSETCVYEELKLTGKYVVAAYRIVYTSDVEINTEGFVRSYTINESKDITLPKLNVSGYKFNGWIDTETGKTATSIRKGSYGDKEFKASLTPLTYKISYNASSGKLVSINSKTPQYQYSSVYSAETDTLDLPSEADEEITRAGYEFEGWYASYNSKTKEYSDKVETIEDLVEYCGYKNSTLYANWRAKEFTIFYVVNNELYTTGTYEYSSNAKDKYNLESIKQNHQTLVFYSDSTCTKTISSIARNSMKDVVVYGKFVPDRYRITYKLDKGIANGSKNPTEYSYSEDGKIYLNSPANKGKKFEGWSYLDGSGNIIGLLDYDDKEMKYYIDASLGEDVILKAVFDNDRYEEYRIIYTDDSGSVLTNPTIYTYETASITLLNPVKTGYTFLGWYDVDTNKKITVIKKGSTGNLKLEARYKANTYTITFDKNGANSGKMATMTVNYDSLTNLTMNAFTRTGYKFTGWKCVIDGQEESFADQIPVYNLTEKNGAKLTFKAQWEPIVYHICFVDEEIKNKDVEYGSGYSLSPALLSKSGSAVTGWYYYNESGKKVTLKADCLADKLTANENRIVKVYPIWTNGVYMVCFNGNGGTGITNSIKATAGKAFSLTSNSFKKTGYTFMGWATSDDGPVEYVNKAKITSTLTTESNYVLYAVWQPISYTVTFDANGGSGTVSDLTLEYDQKYTVESEMLMKSGKEFIGWATSAKAKVPDYAIGEEISNLATANGKKIKLYAVYGN